MPIVGTGSVLGTALASAFSSNVAGAALGDAIRAAVDAVADPGPGGTVDPAPLFQAIGNGIRTYLVGDTALWNAIGAAVVAHIATNALVAGTVVVTSVGGVTPGPGVSGPGVGTFSDGVVG